MVVGYFEARCIGCSRLMGTVEVTVSETDQAIALKLMDVEGEIHDLPGTVVLQCGRCSNRVLLEALTSEEREGAERTFARASHT